MRNTEQAGEVKQTESMNTAMNAGIFFLIMILLEIPISNLIHYVQNLVSEDYSVLVSVLCTQGYLLLGAVVYILHTKTDIKKEFRIQRFRLSTFFLSLVLLITASPMAMWLNLVSQLVVENGTSATIFQITDNLPYGVGIAVIACLPGFIEETIYRGIMFSAFRKRSVLNGIVVSALSFGLMHMNFNQMLYAVYLGIVFALVVEATGSIVSGMILHMLFNAINTSYLYILPKIYEVVGRYEGTSPEDALNATPTKEQLMPMIDLLIPFAIGGLVLMVLLLIAIAKLNGRTFTWASLKEKKDETVKSVNIPLLVGWVICLIFSYEIAIR